MIPPQPLTNFEIQAYYQNEPRFNGDVNNKTVTYFHSFGIEHIPQKIRVFIADKDIIASIYRIQSYDSIMCGYYCIGFTDYMLKGNSLTDFTNFFSPNNFKKNDDIILNYFINKLKNG